MCVATDKVCKNIRYARVLIYRDLRDRVVNGGSWSDSQMGWTKAYMSIT